MMGIGYSLEIKDNNPAWVSFHFFLSSPTNTLGKLFPHRQTPYKQQMNLTVVLHSQTFFGAGVPLP